MNNMLAFYGFRGAVLTTLLAMVAGCSSLSSFEQDATCVAAGTAIGGGAGAGSSGSNAVKGAIGGALVGALVCYVLDGDDDDDGIRNSADKCPGTPLGTTVNAEGCSIAKLVAVTEQSIVSAVAADEDLDGIVDASDLCPGTPAGVKVDKKGCPSVQNIVLDGVTFEFDSATLTEQAKGLLLKQSEVLKSNPALKISITGHTDSYGADKYNKTLSLQRARAVRNFFVDQGIDSSIVTVSGAGEIEPIADNASDVGRSINRRVELKVIRKDN